MIRLYQSDCVTIRDWRCAGHDHCARSDEAAAAHEIALVRRGVFMKHVRGERVLADAGCAVFFQRDEPYRVSHPAGGDACTTIRLRADVLEDLLAARCPARAENRDRPFAATHVASHGASHLLHLRLYQALASGRCNDLMVDELVFDLCDSILGHVAPKPRRAPAPARASTVRAHRETVDGARVLLQRRMSSKVLLGDVAREVHCSPYHLARMFAREAGLPMHRYLNHLRLAEALARMIDGERDLTALALDLGFGDHSHFSNSFRRAFGQSPTQLRRGATARELRELSKNLQV